MSVTAQLADLLVEAGERGTVAFTGAGVSTESGIPDFRSPGGIWTRYAPVGFNEYLHDRAQRVEAWRRGLHTYPPLATAEPNGAHRAIAEWWHAGLLNGVVTQNIDGLHQKAGLPAEAVVELHGNAHWVACLSCGARSDRLSVHARLAAGEDDPACPVCGGILKSTTISFGQALPAAAVEAARRLHAAARLCLIVGSSLVVVPAAMFPQITLEVGGRIAIVNQTSTHLDDYASVLIREPAAGVLQETARLVRAGLPG